MNIRLGERLDRPPPSPWLRPLPVLVAVLAAGGCLLYFTAGLPLWLQVLLCLAVLLPVPVLGLILLLVYSGARHLLGPLVPCEMLRCGRRERYVLFRCLYAAALLGVLAWSYLSWFSGRGIPPAELLWGEGTLSPDDMPKFAGHFFPAFLAAQLTVVVLLTPVYLGGAIAEERERRTLEFLLATDLSGGEIVVSKLAARLLNLGLLLLTGLPVLALTQLWGGVDPLRVACGFAATAVTMLSVGGLTMLNSAGARHPLQAVLRTYGWLAGGLILGLIPGASLGHPLLLVVTLSNAEELGAFVLLFLYGMIHVGLAFILVSAAVSRLRFAEFASVLPADPGAQPALTAGDLPSTFLPPRPLPPVRGRALLWKELYAEPHWRWEQLDSLLGLFLLFLGVSVVAIGVAIVLFGVMEHKEVAWPMNGWARGVGTPLAGLLLLITAFYAAGTVSRERERQTLDGLLTVPDGPAAVLAAKWQGCVLSARSAWWCLAVVWGIGAVTGGLHLLALPVLAAGVAVQTGFVASLGLYCSTVCRSTLRATLATILTLLALATVPWLLWWGRAVLFPSRLDPMLIDWGEALLRYGLSPPAQLWALGIRYDELDANELAAEAGLLLYAGAAWVLWRRALARFRAEAGPRPRGR
jgi:ABC-type transport system involved in multi-copper enzyme maturation permease subunit